MSASAKTGIGVLIVLIALMVAILPIWGGEDEDVAAPIRPTTSVGGSPTGDAVDGGDAVGGGELAGLRADAGLETCPAPSGASASPDAPLSGVVLECLADGSPVDMGAALAGKPAVINLWAYWCGPCREELPAMEEFAARAGDAVTVLTVHKDKSQARGLAMLAELGIGLPGVTDPEARLAAAVSAPNVLPVTVFLRADGTVAKVLAVPFTDADQIAAAAAEHLGVVA